MARAATWKTVLVSSPAILYMFGIISSKPCEAVKVVVVRKDPALTADQIKAYCRENLTGYKQPRYIEFRNELPKSNVGKILRRELRDTAKAGA